MLTNYCLKKTHVTVPLHRAPKKPFSFCAPGIDGFFTAFDVSTLPQQIGQGHFALSGRVGNGAKDAPIPRPPLSELSSSEAREAREAREAESDMV